MEPTHLSDNPAFLADFEQRIMAHLSKAAKGEAAQSADQPPAKELTTEIVAASHEEHPANDDQHPSFGTSSNSKDGTLSHHATAQSLQPDRNQAEAFLRMLDPNASKFTFQTFDDSRAKRRHLALTKLLPQEILRLHLEIRASDNPKPVHLRGRHGTHTREPADRECFDEGRTHRRSDNKKPIGLAMVRRELGEELVVGDTRRRGQAGV
jgi:hypothetical protein